MRCRGREIRRPARQVVQLFNIILDAVGCRYNSPSNRSQLLSDTFPAEALLFCALSVGVIYFPAISTSDCERGQLTVVMGKEQDVQDCVV